jgi:hypothetical protein
LNDQLFEQFCLKQKINQIFNKILKSIGNYDANANNRSQTDEKAEKIVYTDCTKKLFATTTYIDNIKWQFRFVIVAIISANTNVIKFLDDVENDDDFNATSSSSSSSSDEAEENVVYYRSLLDSDAKQECECCCLFVCFLLLLIR